MRAYRFAFAVCTLFACSKTEQGKPAPGASTATTPTTAAAVSTGAGGTTTAKAGATGSAAASVAPSGTASAGGATAGQAKSYEGDYKATAGTLYVPDDKIYKGFHFRGEEAQAGLGAGTMKLTVDPSGRVEGSGEGAFGAFLVSGFLNGTTLTGTILRKEKDGGFTGSFLGEESKTGFDGTLKVSLAQGNVLRDGTFSVKPK